jgi:hypothetical protein
MSNPSIAAAPTIAPLAAAELPIKINYMNRTIQAFLQLFSFLPFFVFGNAICFFVPPEGWECVQPKNLSSQVQIGFVGQAKSGFRPSLNLATEQVDVPLKEYIKAVREIHESEMKVKWRDLGAFSFRAGKGRLTEITSQSPYGEIKMLQGLFVEDGWAYILTGAVLRDEFGAMQKTLLAALHSLSLIPDLFSAITDTPKKCLLQEAFQSFNSLSSDNERQNQWKQLQKMVVEEHASLGSYWHFLVLKEGYSRIFPSDTGQKPSSQ